MTVFAHFLQVRYAGRRDYMFGRKTRNTWGLYPWFPESGLDLIHPEDLATVQTHSPYCVVCEVFGKEGQYLVLRYGQHRFRGKPQLFRSVPPPAFLVGQRVRTRAPRTVRTGVVCGIGWHYKRNEPSFFLDIDGKPLKSRYWAAELEAVPAEQGVSPGCGGMR